MKKIVGMLIYWFQNYSQKSIVRTDNLTNLIGVKSRSTTGLMVDKNRLVRASLIRGYKSTHKCLPTRRNSNILISFCIKNNKKMIIYIADTKKLF